MKQEPRFNQDYLLAGFGFEKERGPYLILDDVFRQDVQRFHWYIRSKVFTMIIKENKMCVGSFSLEDFSTEPCPTRKQPWGKNTSCPPCNDKSGFNPAFYRGDEDRISAQQKKYNAEPHTVYAAYFGVGASKVGISNERRTETRWMEQGARAALVVQNAPNADKARDLEERVHQVLGLNEALRRDFKRKLLNAHFSSDTAERELLDIRSRIQDRLGVEVSVAPVQSFERVYMGSNRLETGCVDVSKTANGVVSGRVEGMVGDTIVFSQKGIQYLYGLKDAVSHVVRFEKDLKPYESTPVAQGSLF